MGGGQMVASHYYTRTCVRTCIMGGGKEKSTNEDLSDSEDRIGKIKKCEPQRQGL